MNKHTVTRSNRSAVLDLVRAEYAKGRGATKRAARILGMEPDAVRAFAKRSGISLPDRSSHIAIVAEEYAKGWGARCRADYAARRCAAYAHLHGSVFVAMDDRAACWAMAPGSREAIAVDALEQDSVLGTFVHSRRSVAPVIAECIRFRLGEIAE